MSIRDLEQAFELISKQKSFFSGPKPLAFIEKAEKNLGLSFPKTYRQFLLKLGCGGVFGREFYGIIHDDFEKSSSIPDAIWATQIARRKYNLPPEYIVIGNANEGDYVLDTSQMNDEGECPVLIWIHQSIPKEKLEVVALDFGKFILEQVSRT